MIGAHRAGAGRHGFLHGAPRARTRRTASSSDSAPAATSAEYSPSECPAANAGGARSGTRSRMAARIAQLVATSAGWALAVSVSSSSRALEDELRERAFAQGGVERASNTVTRGRRTPRARRSPCRPTASPDPEKATRWSSTGARVEELDVTPPCRCRASPRGPCSDRTTRKRGGARRARRSWGTPRGSALRPCRGSRVACFASTGLYVAWGPPRVILLLTSAFFSSSSA